MPPSAVDQDFDGLIPTYTISGRVTDSSGSPVYGVTIRAGPGLLVVTDSNGNYTLAGLATGTYTLTPSKSDYTFSPPTRTVSVPESKTGQDFVALAPGEALKVFVPVVLK